jgi:hypothetical protein
MSRDIVIVIVNRLETGHQSNHGSIPGRVRVLPRPKQSNQSCSGAYTASYTIGFGEIFFRG